MFEKFKKEIIKASTNPKKNGFNTFGHKKFLVKKIKKVEAKIEEAEKRMGIKIPYELRRFYEEFGVGNLNGGVHEKYGVYNEIHTPKRCADIRLRDDCGELGLDDENPYEKNAMIFFEIDQRIFLTIEITDEKKSKIYSYNNKNVIVANSLEEFLNEGPNLDILDSEGETFRKGYSIFDEIWDNTKVEEVLNNENIEFNSVEEDGKRYNALKEYLDRNYILFSPIKHVISNMYFKKININEGIYDEDEDEYEYEDVIYKYYYMDIDALHAIENDIEYNSGLYTSVRKYEELPRRRRIVLRMLEMGAKLDNEYIEQISGYIQNMDTKPNEIIRYWLYDLPEEREEDGEKKYDIYKDEEVRYGERVRKMKKDFESGELDLKEEDYKVIQSIAQEFIKDGQATPYLKEFVTYKYPMFKGDFSENNESIHKVIK